MGGDDKIEMATLPIADRAEAFSYWFDNFFASDPMAKPVVLTVVNTIFMVFFAGCFYAAGSQDRDIAENLWMGFTFAADMAETDHGGPFAYWHQWIFRAMNLTFSFGGAFVFGLVINFLSDFINSKVEGLKLGKSTVIEQEQTMILGWNDRIVPLIDQLCQANESAGGMPIVVLADQDKVWMDEYLNDAIDQSGLEGYPASKSMIVTRQGNRITSPHLIHAAITYARSIIILSEGNDSDEADCACIRTTLALTCGLPQDKAPTLTPGVCHIVLELQDVDNAEVAMLGVADRIDAAQVLVPIIAHDMAGKLMVQSAREVGLYKCFAALLCFAGSECYFAEWPDLIGTSFRDIAFRFKDAVVVGLAYRNPETSPNGMPVQLNPPHDYLLQYGDKVLVLAEDDDTYQPGPSNEMPTTPLPPFELPAKKAEKILLCGWRRDFDDMICELDKWCPPGSAVTVMAIHNPDGINPNGDTGPPEMGQAMIVEGWKSELADGGMDEYWDKTLYEFRCKEDQTWADETDPSQTFMVTGNMKMENLTDIDFVYGDPTVKKDLEMMPLEQYDAAIVLAMDHTIASEDTSGTLSGDSRTFCSMLILRNIMDTRKSSHACLVAEIQDTQTAEMMSLTKCSDCCTPNVVVSMMLAQCSENRMNGYVIDDLFSPDGNEMHVKDVRLFCAPDEQLCYWDLLARALMRNMLVLGWIRKNDDPDVDPHDATKWVAVLNPEDKTTKHAWTGRPDQSGDCLIVISED